MAIQFRAFSDFLSIVGMKGTGKTVRTKSYCKDLTRLIFIDPTWQVGDLGYVVHYPERILPAFQRFRKVVYQPVIPDDLKGLPTLKLNPILYRRVFSVCLGLTNYTLGIDELDKFARPRWYVCSEFEEIVNRGRMQGIGLIGNTRRPHRIHNDIRSSSDHVVCFKLHEERDLKYMAEWIGIEKQKIKDLQKYESFYYDVHGSKVTRQQALY